MLTRNQRSGGLLEPIRDPARNQTYAFSPTTPTLSSQLWLIGGLPHVKMVITIRWSRLSGGRVKGYLQVSRLIGNAAIVTQEEVSKSLQPNG